MKSEKFTPRDVADWLTAVAEPQRVKIITALADGPLSVGVIAEKTGQAIVNTSHHLGVLRQAELVQDEKDGRFVKYTLVDVEKVAGGRYRLSLGDAVTLDIDPKQIG